MSRNSHLRSVLGCALVVALGCSGEAIELEGPLSLAQQPLDMAAGVIVQQDAGIVDAGTADAGTADAGTADAGTVDAGDPVICLAPTSSTGILNDYDLSYYPWSDDPGGLVVIPPHDVEFPSLEEALQSLGVDPRMEVTPEGDICFNVLDSQGQEQTVCPPEDELPLWDLDLVATQLKTGETQAKSPTGGTEPPPRDGGVGDGGVGGGGDGGTASTENCCMCTYQHVPACAGLNREQCGKNSDCTWPGDGPCVGYFENQCKEWKAQQDAAGWCTRKVVVAEPPTGNEFPKGVCKAFRIKRYGHSSFPSGCQKIQNMVRVCVNAQPTCSEFDVDYDGCSTFEDLAGAAGYMKKIVPTLGGSQCVKVSANQCMSSRSCQTRFNYTITSNGTCSERPGPCKIGEFCYGGISKTCWPEGDHGKVAMCSTETGIKAQTCCCETVDANGVRKDCKFKEGRTCN
jgi:hypothetical protein